MSDCVVIEGVVTQQVYERKVLRLIYPDDEGGVGCCRVLLLGEHYFPSEVLALLERNCVKKDPCE